MKKIGLIYGMIMLLVPNNGKAQSKDIGFEIGYGKAIIDSYSGWNLFNNEQNSFLKLGGKYEYSPKKAYFKTTIGISYDRRNVDNSNFNYFRTPWGIDLKFGNKVEFSVGAGIYISYLFLYQIQSDYSDYIDNTTRFQFGWHPSAGIKYQLNDRYFIKTTIQKNIDAVKMHERQGYSPGGAEYDIYDKGRDIFVIIGIYYRLTND